MESSDRTRKRLYADRPTIAWVRRVIAALMSPLENLPSPAWQPVPVPVRAVRFSGIERARPGHPSRRATL